MLPLDTFFVMLILNILIMEEMDLPEEDNENAVKLLVIMKL